MTANSTDVAKPSAAEAGDLNGKAPSQTTHSSAQERRHLIVLALIAGGYFFLRTSPSDIASMEALQASLRRGQPTLIEFYSNF